MIKLGISGCFGKMGSRIAALALEDGDFNIAMLLEKAGHPKIGSKFKDILITDDPGEIKNVDCLIEFTLPDVTISHMEMALKYKKPSVIGTTGFTDEQKARLKEISKSIPLLLSPNMSIGVNTLFKLVNLGAGTLRNYKVSIIEAHHIHKKDAPSGTAKRIAEIVKEASGKDIRDIKSIREDEIVGDHEVVFDSAMDTIRLIHSAKNRDIFAEGALQAAKWIIKKNRGIFDIKDMMRVD